MGEKIQVSCEMEVTLKIIGGKWKLLILHYLLEEGPKRYNEILRFLEHANKKTLTIQLRELEEDGIIIRKVYETVPAQVEYSATEKGKTLIPIVEMMCDWGCRNIGDKFELTNAQCSGEE
ncbi:winged helix-turn-helix transcriptional regulator [Kineothrix sp. MB12-C1]|uniref:winged helix-turn-helix transcriptional regulator n=1 Tax=Kineothrix sp. MB12-C1 TaxID=3070215 RepID=UPI0027D23D21|nr:helix-turn-helix domain-containing protein [Kineothrix sp. MB12-C1]WMC93057.1 helix-turn-helix domain-containing protein [Kineothrix sp. MB12-C1]